MDKKFESRELRKTVLEMAFKGATVHIPCAFSIVEIFAVLYRKFLTGLDSPKAQNRDYVVLSKGHGVMAQYACLKELGWIGQNEIDGYFSDGSRLKGLSDAHVPGLEVTSGSLGHGLSVGVGLALAAKMKATGQRVFAIVGDGEANEGTIWEALLFAHHWKLDNLVVIIDKNEFQAMGTTDDVLTLGVLKDKLDAFGFTTKNIDGHNEHEIEMTLEGLLSEKDGRPKAIVANTVKGKGVSFMEKNNKWHYTRLDQETYQRALNELGYQDA